MRENYHSEGFGNQNVSGRLHICITSNYNEHRITPSRFPSALGRVGPWTSCQIRKLRVVHALRLPVTFSPPPTLKETAIYRSRHASRHVRDARAVKHIGIASPQWRGKRSRHSPRMRNPQFCVSGKRPMVGVVQRQSEIINPDHGTQGDTVKRQRRWTPLKIFK